MALFGNNMEELLDESSMSLLIEGTDPEIKQLLKNWKVSNETHKRMSFKNENLSEEEYNMLIENYKILRTAESYDDYRKAFEKICRFANISPKGTIFIKLKIKSGDKEGRNKIYIEYSQNTKKLKLPEGVKLYHMSKVAGIKELHPNFRGKSAKGFMYYRPRVYLTIHKNMPKFLADYRMNEKVHKYEVKVPIKEVYVDPLVWGKMYGAVYVESFKDIPVEEMGISKKNTNEATDEFIREFWEDDEEVISETVIKTIDDILYNKEKFDNGDINLCFITGFSSSGKSTLGAYMAGKENVEHYDLDQVMFNFTVPDDKVSSKGKMYNEFFNNTIEGKKFRTERNPVLKQEIKDTGTISSKTFNKYTEDLTKAFVNFGIKYSRSHKNTKFILEGVWLYRFIDPNTLKDYAVFIKGTSAVESSKRAIKRDYAEREEKGVSEKKNKKAAMKKLRRNLFNMPGAESKMKKYINTFRNK